MNDRARLTLPDVLWVLMSLAFVAPLYVVFRDGFSANIGQMSTGEAYLYQLILPLMVLVLLTMVFRKGMGGLS